MTVTDLWQETWDSLQTVLLLAARHCIIHPLSQPLLFRFYLNTLCINIPQSTITTIVIYCLKLKLKFLRTNFQNIFNNLFTNCLCQHFNNDISLPPRIGEKSYSDWSLNVLMMCLQKSNCVHSGQLYWWEYYTAT